MWERGQNYQRGENDVIQENWSLNFITQDWDYWINNEDSGATKLGIWQFLYFKTPGF